MGDRYRFRLGHVTDLTTPTIPLIDMGRKYTYHGLAGGLYPGGYLNTPPPAHLAAGLAAAALVEPLDTAGNPDPNGKIVVVVVGMSSMSWEACLVGGGATTGCDAGTLLDRFENDANHNPKTVLVNGAGNGQTIDVWDAAADTRWDLVRDSRLPPYTEAQVQVVFLKNVFVRDEFAPEKPTLPDADAHAWAERDGLIAVIAAAATRYPNLRQVFVWSRSYAGYSDPQVVAHPEPHAYENGFAVRAVVNEHIAGVLPAAPWVGWGPYLWANGATPRSDGLTWETADYDTPAPPNPHPLDYMHQGLTGVAKAAGQAHDFFMASQFTPWYRS